MVTSDVHGSWEASDDDGGLGVAKLTCGRQNYLKGPSPDDPALGRKTSLLELSKNIYEDRLVAPPEMDVYLYPRAS